MTFSFTNSLWQRHSELLQVLVDRNLKVRYRGSILGVYWSLLNPLMMTGLYTAIFGATFASYYNSSIINYILAAFTGLVVMNFFSSTTNQALPSLVNNGELLNKIPLPMGIFPLSVVFANLFQFSVTALPLLMIVTLITSHSLVNLIALFCPIFSLILVSTGVGFLASSLYIFFRDVGYFYELLVFILGLSSPIFYPSAIVPDTIKPILLLNPILPIIESIRQISLSGNFPDLFLITHGLLAGIIVLTFGWYCFKSLQYQFMDLL
jgi:ABC-type polysaccharide/polyol phosphate export permease